MLAVLNKSWFGKGFFYLYHIALDRYHLYATVHTLYSKAYLCTFLSLDELYSILQSHPDDIHRIISSLSYLKDQITYFQELAFPYRPSHDNIGDTYPIGFLLEYRPYSFKFAWDISVKTFLDVWGHIAWMWVGSLHIAIEVDTKPIVLSKVFVREKHLLKGLLGCLLCFLFKGFTILDYIFGILFFFILLFFLFDKNIGENRILNQFAPTFSKGFFILGIRNFLIV